MRFYKIYNKNKKISFKKIISITLTIGLFLNNSIASFSGILSEDRRYETFEGNNIRIDNILEEDKVDVEIEGNTLINHAEYMSISHSSWTTFDGEYATFTNPKGPSNISFKLNAMKPNTTYTVIFNVISLLSSGYGQYDLFPDNYEQLGKISSLGTIKRKFTTENDISTLESLRYYVSSPLEGTLKVSAPIVIEGDWTNKEIPDYFEGIKSVGELEDNKVEIISQNKNLIDLNIYKDANVENGGTIEVLSDNIKITTPKTTLDSVDCYMNVGVNANKSWFIRDFTKYAIPIKPNTKYTLSYNVEVESVNNHDAYIEFRDSNYNQLKMHEYRNNNIENKFTVTSPADAKYVVIRFDNNLGGNSLTFKNIQFEESSEKTSYKQYVENKIEIPLSEPLRSLPNGVKDRIIKRNGQWVVERNCGETIFNGTEDWRTHNLAPIADNTFVAYLSGTSNYVSIKENNQSDGYLISDKFIGYSANYMDCNDVDGITMGSTDMFNYIIRINKNNLEIPDINGFKKWLSENNIKVCYKLETPIYEPLNINSTINTYLDITHISNNSNIPTNMKVTVDRAINRAVEAIELVKTNPTVENLSLARMWTNLLKETINKDKLQSQINDIIKVEDLQIEKKTATSNIDLYIKPLNSLSMSLSTNQIMFEDYSSVNDLDMDNALQISVSSSLPYNLNSYLETEIQNNDGSSKINKDLLHIKEDTDNDYKQFLGISQKLILKEDCIAGSNNIHNIDLRLKASVHDADVYKTTIKFEAEQK